MGKCVLTDDLSVRAQTIAGSVPLGASLFSAFFFEIAAAVFFLASSCVLAFLGAAGFFAPPPLASAIAFLTRSSDTWLVDWLQRARESARAIFSERDRANLPRRVGVFHSLVHLGRTKIRIGVLDGLDGRHQRLHFRRHRPCCIRHAVAASYEKLTLKGDFQS